MFFKNSIVSYFWFFDKREKMHLDFKKNLFERFFWDYKKYFCLQSQSCHEIGKIIETFIIYAYKYN